MWLSFGTATVRQFNKTDLNAQSGEPDWPALAVWIEEDYVHSRFAKGSFPKGIIRCKCR